MKVLVIHDDAGEPGGANVYRQDLSNHLKKRGYELFLFTLKPGPVEDPGRSFQFRPRIRVRYVRYFTQKIFNPFLFFALRKFIRKVKPDIIHIHNNYQFTSSVLIACRGRVPVIQTVHDHRIACPTGRGFTSVGEVCRKHFGNHCYREDCLSLRDYLIRVLPRAIEGFLLRRMKMTFLVPNRDLQEKLKDYGLSAVLFKHYVDLDRFSTIPTKPQNNMVLYAGRLHEGKGIAVLVEAFRDVLEKKPDARLELVGNDESDGQFERTVRQLGINGAVNFTGNLPHDRIQELYQKASLVVVPSTWVENSPLTILEAMACSRPVVGTSVGGIPEMIENGFSGLLCRPGDAGDLSRKILELLEDKEKSAAMGRKGKEIAEREYGVPDMLRRFDEVVGEVISGPGHAPDIPISETKKSQGGVDAGTGDKT